jgi:2-keto-4-pentenoate hydratase/2-oxohepta-3-ene-1,7-dioic acid hydratase in catechol pathway
MKYQLFSYFRSTKGPAAALIVDETAYDLQGVAQMLGLDLQIDCIENALANWPNSHDRLRDLASKVAGASNDLTPFRLKLEEIQFAPILSHPGVIYGAGANYRDHVEAMAKAFNMKLVSDPKAEGVPPWYFMKAGRGTLAAHREDIPYPAHASMLDWEAELAVIIGVPGQNIPVESALEHVAGYTCTNDLSARDQLRRDKVDPSSPFRFDWLGHKCFPGSCPLGPKFTPSEFISSPEKLGIKLWVNGDLKQDSNTSNHLYSVAEQIAYLSSRVPLFPGDVILTGTPAGVGMETGTFLKRGDIIRISIEGIGELENKIV